MHQDQEPQRPMPKVIKLYLVLVHLSPVAGFLKASCSDTNFARTAKRNMRPQFMLKQAELRQHIPITRNPPCIRKLSALFFFFILYVGLARVGYSSSISSPLVLPVPCRTPWWRRWRGVHIHQPGLELYGCSRRRLRQRKSMESPAFSLLLLGCTSCWA